MCFSTSKPDLAQTRELIVNPPTPGRGRRCPFARHSLDGLMAIMCRGAWPEKPGGAPGAGTGTDFRHCPRCPAEKTIQPLMQGAPDQQARSGGRGQQRERRTSSWSSSRRRDLGPTFQAIKALSIVQQQQQGALAGF
jgi:hypothetical protein